MKFQMRPDIRLQPLPCNLMFSYFGWASSLLQALQIGLDWVQCGLAIFGTVAMHRHQHHCFAGKFLYH